MKNKCNNRNKKFIGKENSKDFYLKVIISE